MNQFSVAPFDAPVVPVPSRGERGVSLGLSASNSAELIQQVERGFSFKTLHTLESRSGLPGAALAGLVGIPERTLARRRSKGKFTPEESERCCGWERCSSRQWNCLREITRPLCVG